MPTRSDSYILIRGGGDLASGAAWRLRNVGFRVMITEIPQPLAVRRLVSFAETVYRGEFVVEGVKSSLAGSFKKALSIMDQGEIAVLVDPQADCIAIYKPAVIVDGRMLKQDTGSLLPDDILVIGLGPGFTVGANCHAVIETNRGHTMGRVYWSGSAMPDTGVPEKVDRYQAERVLRAPCVGLFVGKADIGEVVDKDQVIAEISGRVVKAPIAGVLRGILHSGVSVVEGLKLADIDPRSDPSYCTKVSDKSLAVAGGVLEAVLSKPELRALICS